MTRSARKELGNKYPQFVARVARVMFFAVPCTSEAEDIYLEQYTEIGHYKDEDEIDRKLLAEIMLPVTELLDCDLSHPTAETFIDKAYELWLERGLV